MADVTAKQLAETIGTPVERLLQQMQEAGLPQKNEEYMVSEEQKQELLSHLKRIHGETESAPRKITLKRRTLSTLKTSSGAGRGRTVSVEVRKKRTYVRRGAVESEEVTKPLAITTSVADESQSSSEEAKRRAAHAELEAEAEKRLEETAKKVADRAELSAKEEEKRKIDATARAKSKKETEDEAM